MAFTLQAVKPGQFSLLRAVTGLVLLPSNRAVSGYIIVSSLQPSLILGAAVIEQTQDIARIWLTILPQFQRQGLGRGVYSLLVSNYLKPSDSLTMTPWQGIEDDSGRYFLESLDFDLKEECKMFDADFTTVKLHAKKHFNRMLQRGSIPLDDVSCSFGEEVDIHIAQRLLSSDFTNAVNIRLGETLVTNMMPGQIIFGLHWQKRMVGVNIGRLVDNALWTDAYVIEPNFRRSWAHIAIKHLGYEAASAHHPNITRFKFITTESQRDTNSYARRINAEMAGKISYYEKVSTGE